MAGQTTQDRPARSSGTLPLGRVLGVPVELNPSWFLLAAVIVVLYGPTLGPARDPAEGYVTAAAFALLLLARVLLHEVEHCVADRSLGLRVRRISVSFLAGLTEVSDPPPTPGRAWVVSAAGPAVSLLLTGLAVLGAVAVPGPSAVHSLLVLSALSNGGLAVFNLLPGLPLDGGAMLRALVWKITGSAATGTVAGAQAGRVLAVVVVPLAVLVSGPLLGARLSTFGIVSTGFVALFLWAGASGALRSARVEKRLDGLPAGLLARPALLVPTSLPLAEALRRAHESGLRALVVVDALGRPTALVSEAAVVAVPEHRRPWIPVADVARPLAPGLVLDPALSGIALVEAVRAARASEYLVAGAPPRVLVAADLARAAEGPRAAVA